MLSLGIKTQKYISHKQNYNTLASNFALTLVERNI